MVDESAGGFAVECDQPCHCQIGDAMELQIESDWINVQVAYLCQEPSEAKTFDERPLPGRWRIGLSRVAAPLPALLVPKGQLPFARLRRPLVPLESPGWPIAGTIIGAVALLGGAIWLFHRVEEVLPAQPGPYGHARPPQIELPPVDKVLVSPGYRPADDDWEPFKHGEAKPRPYRPVQRTGAKGMLPNFKSTTKKPVKPLPLANVPAGPTRPAEPQRETEHVPASVLPLADPQFLLRREVSDALSLTRNQQERLARLVYEHRTSAGGSGASSDDENVRRLQRRGWDVLSVVQQRSLVRMQSMLRALQRQDDN